MSRPSAGERAPKRLLHLVNANSTNIGNGALIEGTERILSEDAPYPIAWHREAWDDYTFELKQFDRTFVSLVNQHDALIVNGAVAINGRAYLKNAGMRFDLPLELWSQIERPVVFYGISYRHWEGQPFHHRDKLSAALGMAQSSPNMILALRNDGTLEWLRDTMKIDVSRARVVPDPAVFVPADKAVVSPEFETDRMNVILAFNDEDSDYRYADPGSRDRMLRAIAAALVRAMSKWDMNVILAPHYFDDHKMISDFVGLCPPRLAHQRMISSGLSRVGDTRRFYGRYAKADLVMAMRVHSMSPCIGLGVPMIPLTTQARMTDFLDGIGIGDVGVDALADNLEERLFAAIDRTLRGKEQVLERFRSATAQMRQQARAFNADVLNLVSEGIGHGTDFRRQD